MPLKYSSLKNKARRLFTKRFSKERKQKIEKITSARNEIKKRTMANYAKLAAQRLKESREEVKSIIENGLQGIGAMQKKKFELSGEEKAIATRIFNGSIRGNEEPQKIREACELLQKRLGDREGYSAKLAAEKLGEALNGLVVLRRSATMLDLALELQNLKSPAARRKFLGPEISGSFESWRKAPYAKQGINMREYRLREKKAPSK